MYATEPPEPPKVNEGLIIAGKEILFNNFLASSKDLTVYPYGKSRPISNIACLNISLLSAVSIAFLLAPMSSTLYFLRIPSSSSFMATFKAVCPPTVGKIASGFSFFIIASRYSVEIGSI